MAHAVFFSDYQMSPTHGSMPYEILRFQSPKDVLPPFIVEVSDDSGQDFESIPLSPMDVSVLLDKMKEIGVNRVVITSPLGWQEADSFALDLLMIALEGAKQLVFSQFGRDTQTIITDGQMNHTIRTTRSLNTNR